MSLAVYAMLCSQYSDVAFVGRLCDSTVKGRVFTQVSTIFIFDGENLAIARPRLKDHLEITDFNNKDPEDS